MATADELFVLGVTAHQTGDLEAAERYYRELVAAVPTHAPALSNLASLVARRGSPDEADALYSRAIGADPISSTRGSTAATCCAAAGGSPLPRASTKRCCAAPRTTRTPC